MDRVSTEGWSKKRFAQSREMWRTIAYNYVQMLEAKEGRIAKLEQELAERP